MNNHLVEQFEHKLIDIINQDGIDNDGKVTINATDLLQSIRLYKNQVQTIEKLEERVENLQQHYDNSLECNTLWHMRLQQVLLQRDDVVENYTQLYEFYTRIFNDAITMKFNTNAIRVENKLLKNSLQAIVESDVDSVEYIKEYAKTALIAVESES